MRKLASVIDQLVDSVKAEPTKLAAHSLSPVNTPPSISTELSVALMKTAAALRATDVEVTHAELKTFLENLSNG